MKTYNIEVTVGTVIHAENEEELEHIVDEKYSMGLGCYINILSEKENE